MMVLNSFILNENSRRLLMRIITVLMVLSFCIADLQAANWPSWRWPNLNGVAVKDLSRLFLIQSTFEGNKTDINAYQKKDIFGGGTVYVVRQTKPGGPLSYKLDSKSQLFALPADTANAIPDRIEDQAALDDAITTMLDLLNQSGHTTALHPKGFLR